MTGTAWDSAVELEPYRHEPRQMASGAVGKNGYLRLGFERRGARTVLVDLERRAPLFTHKALYWDEAMPDLPCVFLITTTGCVLQGDRLALDIRLEAGAQAHLTTQSGTQVHSMDANFAAQTQHIVLGEDAYLEYLPDALFPNAHARFLSQTHVTVAPSATMLYSEILMPGRKHHGPGERFEFDLFSSTTRVEDPLGRELMTERFVVEPFSQNLRQVGHMGDFDVFGNVLLLTTPVHAEQVFLQTEATFDMARGVCAGASRLPNQAGVIYKILARESRPVRELVRAFWATVRQTVIGAPLMKAFLWR